MSPSVPTLASMRQIREGSMSVAYLQQYKKSLRMIRRRQNKTAAQGRRFSQLARKTLEFEAQTRQYLVRHRI